MGICVGAIPCGCPARVVTQLVVADVLDRATTRDCPYVIIILNV